MYDPTPVPSPYDPARDPGADAPAPLPLDARPAYGAASPTPPTYGGEPPQPAFAPPPTAATPHAPQARFGLGRVIVAGVLGGVLGAGLVGGAVYLLPPRSGSSTTTAVQTGAGGLTQSGKVTIVTDAKAQPIEAVATKVTPSVVNVAVAQSGLDPYSGTLATRIVGNGSGVIIRADGYILTNNHVVEGADRLVITIGGNDLVAKVVGTDPQTDLAVIKVDRTGLPAAEIGASSKLSVGETVVAVGSPFGLDRTVTSGIVSALHRSNISQGSDVAAYTNLIQTDASINPGNSGGALADLNGRVVGINTLIQTGGAQQSAGIGFAIPIDFAMRVADQLIRTGKAEHPYMGLSMAGVDSTVAQQLGQPDLRGVLLQSVVAGSPADKGGLKTGDVITSIGGDPVANVDDAFAAIRSRKIGDVVDVSLVRDKATLAVKVTLGSDAAK
ncbi:MAG TPA: trypsin-like peptidase domain-containing protein [Coriobacteriia bacterium]